MKDLFAKYLRWVSVSASYAWMQAATWVAEKTYGPLIAMLALVGLLFVSCVAHSSTSFGVEADDVMGIAADVFPAGSPADTYPSVIKVAAAAETAPQAWNGEALIGPDEDVYVITTPYEGVFMFCRQTPEGDGLHACQPWQLVSSHSGFPVAGYVWCFVREMKPNPADGQEMRNWECNEDRALMREKYKSNPLKFKQNRPLKKGEYAI